MKLFNRFKIGATICFVLFAFSGCAGLQFGANDPNDVAKLFGSESTFWVLTDNPGSLGLFKDSLNLAMPLCDGDEPIDLLQFTAHIMKFAESVLDDKSYSGDLKTARLVVDRLKLFVEATYKTPEDYDEVKAYICSFLEGVQETVDGWQ